MANWYNGGGADNDVVLFSKIRLARNLADIPFKSKMSPEVRRSTVKKLFATVKNSPLAGEFNLVDLSGASDIKAISYAEKQAISPDFAKEKGAFLFSNDENSSVMLCEEDHIKITSFAPGLDLKAAYERANRIDDVFIENLPIAFDKWLGFLTASPMNIGTGMKASVGLHLPAIKENGGIGRLASMVGKLGISLRPMYKENGAFYILTNQLSLGITEAAAIENMNSVSAQIILQERNLRETMRNSERWEDRLYRSMGTLKMARKLGFAEFISLISDVRLGVALGFFETEVNTIGWLIHNLADGTVLSDSDSEASPELAPKLRAEIVRAKL